MNIGTNFWNIAWGNGWTDYFKNDVDWKVTKDPWHPAFLRDIRGYKVFRFMNWDMTCRFPAESTIQHWDQRIQKTADHYQAPAIAYEWMIDLCNRSNADLWLCLPHLTFEEYKADPDRCYWKKLAKMVKTKLATGLNVYLEYSNETWNTDSFYRAQYDYCNRMGSELGVGGEVFHVYAAVRLIKTFQDVFGDQKSRIKGVLSGFIHDVLRTERMVRSLSDKAINPHAVEPVYFGISNYIGGYCDGTQDPESLQILWSRTVKEQAIKMEKQKVAIAGMGLIAYEGGTDMSNAGFFRLKEKSYELYTQMLSTWTETLDLWMQYTHTGNWWEPGQERLKSSWAWGLLDKTGQDPQTSPTYRAVFDWIKRS